MSNSKTRMAIETTIIVGTTLFVVLKAFGGAEAAEPRAEFKREAVTYSDLDLARDDHRRILDERVNRASIRVCRDLAAKRGEWAFVRRCAEKARAGARSEMDRAVAQANG